MSKKNNQELKSEIKSAIKEIAVEGLAAFFATILADVDEDENFPAFAQYESKPGKSAQAGIAPEDFSLVMSGYLYMVMRDLNYPAKSIRTMLQKVEQKQQSCSFEKALAAYKNAEYDLFPQGTQDRKAAEVSEITEVTKTKRGRKPGPGKTAKPAKAVADSAPVNIVNPKIGGISIPEEMLDRRVDSLKYKNKMACTKMMKKFSAHGIVYVRDFFREGMPPLYKILSQGGRVSFLQVIKDSI